MYLKKGSTESTADFLERALTRLEEEYSRFPQQQDYIIYHRKQYAGLQRMGKAARLALLNNQLQAKLFLRMQPCHRSYSIVNMTLHIMLYFASKSFSANLEKAITPHSALP